MNDKLRTILWVILAAAYLAIRLIFTVELDGLGQYTPYIFEIGCVIAAACLYGPGVAQLFSFQKSWLKEMIFPLAAGALVHRLAIYLGIGIPFDLSGTMVLVFLLIVAPILEELIFRFLLWQPLLRASKMPVIALAVTSVLFSYAHFHPFWFLGENVHQFIYYQTAYTLLLGFGCGYFVFRQGSLLGAMLAHFAFNLGFYLALYL